MAKATKSECPTCFGLKSVRSCIPHIMENEKSVSVSFFSTIDDLHKLTWG